MNVSGGKALRELRDETVNGIRRSGNTELDQADAAGKTGELLRGGKMHENLRVFRSPGGDNGINLAAGFLALIAQQNCIASMYAELRGSLGANFAGGGIILEFSRILRAAAGANFGQSLPLRAGDDRRLEMQRARLGNFAD